MSLVQNDNKTLGLKERWDMAKQVIDSEHELIAQRTKRFLTLQGFLFTVVVTITGAFFIQSRALSVSSETNGWLSTGTLFLFLVFLLVLVITYMVAVKSAIFLIVATALAKKQTYYASYWFWCHENKDKFSDNSPPEWLDHHAKMKDKLTDNPKFREYLWDTQRIPHTASSDPYIVCGTVVWRIFFKRRQKEKREINRKLLENFFTIRVVEEFIEELIDGKKDGGTSVGYAKLLLKAWAYLFYGILVSLVLWVLVSLTFGSVKDTSKGIVIDNMPPAVQGDYVTQHEDKATDSGKGIVKTNSGNSSVTFHLFERSPIDLHLNLSEKPDSKSLTNRDNIDKLINHLKMPDTPDKSVPETSENSGEESE